MSWWNMCSSPRAERVREIVGDLVRMWGKADVKRNAAFVRVGADLGLSPRRAKTLMYPEHSEPALTDAEVAKVERLESAAWLRLADEFRQMAEYCEARAEARRSQESLRLVGGNEWAGQQQVRRSA